MRMKLKWKLILLTVLIMGVITGTSLYFMNLGARRAEFESRPSMSATFAEVSLLPEFLGGNNTDPPPRWFKSRRLIELHLENPNDLKLASELYRLDNLREVQIYLDVSNTPDHQPLDTDLEQLDLVPELEILKVNGYRPTSQGIINICHHSELTNLQIQHVDHLNENDLEQLSLLQKLTDLSYAGEIHRFSLFKAICRMPNLRMVSRMFPLDYDADEPPILFTDDQLACLTQDLTLLELPVTRFK
ncbi:MAG: hypothetical protein R3C11_20030 [Planctomycetaceae bacterium]